ncbi:helix-turn-helix domain-containing protein [Paracrocinitomix mangrovi]|uniref:helix-turn-helix domain-containing protein n=1 Tax=Paracrocinitomix mangrovi TaxID=2862509 RepID=UPI001C8E4C5E|nr:helix-turn-helix domain-containing protein [Paracrocinitomix mangrovi]UKN02232.1 helix-turn-helix domain-containing protein [Paracrocinitomix mangrovi]
MAISLEDIAIQLQEISEGQNRIEETLRGIQHLYKDILDIDEASAYTGLKKSYLYKLCSERKIPHYKNSGKMLRFKKSDLSEYQLRNKVKSIYELEDEAINHLKY